MKLAPKIIILLLIVTLGVMSIYSFYQVRRAEKSFNADAEANHVLLLSNSLGFLSNPCSFFWLMSVSFQP